MSDYMLIWEYVNGVIATRGAPYFAGVPTSVA